MQLRRKDGATLGLIAALVLVIIVIGFACFFLAKILGGGRELSNATDAGCINLAKQAMRNPGLPPSSFDNPDVKNNFGMYADNGKLDLLTYNRCVAHALIVALNAQVENTSAAANNARKVWQALHDVGQELRKETGSEGSPSAEMTTYFNNVAGLNNTKMLNNKPVSLNKYNVGFMKQGQSSNIYVNKALFQDGIGTGNIPPINDSGNGYPGNSSFKFLAGYKPFQVNLSASGDVLTFCTVPTLPLDRPHLVSAVDFNGNKSDSFIVGKGNPPYPEKALPGNSFLTSGKAKESKSNAFVDAIACAIVGCQYPSGAGVDTPWQMDMSYGYIQISNGASGSVPVQPIAEGENDIFNKELAGGIVSTGSGEGNLYTDSPNFALWNQWAEYNLTGASMPSLSESKAKIKKGRTETPSLLDLKQIIVAQGSTNTCFWTDYTNPMPAGKQFCSDNLDNFMAGFKRTTGEPISGTAPYYAPNGFTYVEELKTALLAARIIREDYCSTLDAAAVGKAMVNTKDGTTGMKWFDHNKAYSSPNPSPYNFGEVKSPYDYLQMIDQAASIAFTSACGLGSTSGTTFDHLLKRCRQIKPSATPSEVINCLKSKPLPLSGTLFIAKDSNGNLFMTDTRPIWALSTTLPDGTSVSCGSPYDVVFNCINTRKNDSDTAPIGDANYHEEPYTRAAALVPGPDGATHPLQCNDIATWIPSSGYNYLLGQLNFHNSCSGNETFCKPN